MKFAFTSVPGDPGGVPRPVLTFSLDGSPLPVTCLLDTGSVHNRLPGEWAALAGISEEGRKTERIGIGGEKRSAFLVEDLQVVLAGISLTLDFWFVPGWEPPFGLLGQEGFLQYLNLNLNAAEYWFELTDEIQVRP